MDRTRRDVCQPVDGAIEDLDLVYSGYTGTHCRCYLTLIGSD